MEDRTKDQIVRLLNMSECMWQNNDRCCTSAEVQAKLIDLIADWPAGVPLPADVLRRVAGDLVWLPARLGIA